MAGLLTGSGVDMVASGGSASRTGDDAGSV
jgi:hypothetical protein